jgi:hypothetical protein
MLNYASVGAVFFFLPPLVLALPDRLVMSKLCI